MKNRFAVAVVLGTLALGSSARAEDTAPVVHVDSGSDVVLKRVEPGGRATEVCRAPCDRALSTSNRYELDGDGLRASNAFHLPATRAATVTVKRRTAGGYVSGLVLMIVSGVLTTGAAFLAGGAVAAGSGDFGIGGALLGLAGIVSATGGLATGIPAIVILSNNVQSRAAVFATTERAALPAVPISPIFTAAF
ncbi:MAG TPA: hypothetical protein VGH28_15045 [Polyangiaceae bacterium]|jgi:hypothetical protein